jgi:hypothetical protein
MANSSTDEVAIGPEHITNLIQALNEANHRIEQTEAQLQALLHHQHSINFSQSKPLEPKISDPEPFSGEKNKVNNFVASCRMKFLAQPARYASNEAKIMYAASFLRGSAFSWFEPFLEATDPLPDERTSFEAFAKSLKSMYGDPDQRRTAERSLMTLQQKGSAAAYASEFRRLQAHVTWSEDALIAHFQRGLKEELKDLLAHEEPTASLNMLVEKVIR